MLVLAGVVSPSTSHMQPCEEPRWFLCRPVGLGDEAREREVLERARHQEKEENSDVAAEQARLRALAC